MFIFLSTVIILLQITLFLVVLLLYKKQNNSLPECETNDTALKDISGGIQFELVKQVIYLEKFTLGFKTPYSGYLHIVARACDVCFRDDRCIKVKRQLDGLFLEKDELISIRNPIDLKCVKFIQN